MLFDFDDEMTSNISGTVPGQLVTAAAIGGRVKDAGAARDWAAGEPVFAYFLVTKAAASNPGTSMTVDVIGADDALLTVNVAVLSTRTVPTAQLLAGAKFTMPALLSGSRRRFLGARFTPAGANPTQGAYTVGLIRGQARQQAGGTSWSGSVSW